MKKIAKLKTTDDRLEKLSKLAKAFPHQPGIYKMKNKEGVILYVGKAKNLRHRVKTYFQKGYEHSMRTRKLLENTEDIEYIVTDNELEAYVLETNLIKELRPRYNILMKDDKNFVYIKIQLNEDFPRIRVVRKMEKDGAKYIGPKTGATKVFEFFRILKKLFPFRHCQLNIEWIDDVKSASKNLPKNPPHGLPGVDYLGEPNPKHIKVTNQVIDYPCLDYFIKRCPGPCIGACSPEEYRVIIDQIIGFLEGKGEELLKKLRASMMEAAQTKKFELAARLRDKLLTVEEIMEKQKVSDPERKDTDVIHFHIELGRVYVNIFLIRDGKLIRHENFILDAFELDKAGDVSSSEILKSFMQSYYEKAADIPKEILIPESIEDQAIIEIWISQMKNEKVKILIPQKGEKNKLLELSRKNAETFAKQYRIKFLAEQREKQAVFDLAEALELTDKKTGKPLELCRIECYDISHFGGEHTVGSMVVFENGYPKREHYRHFKLRTVQGKPDDFASIKEVFSRRLKYLTTKIDKDIILKIPTKKELLEMKKILEEQYRITEGMEKKDSIVAKRNNQIIGFGRLHKLNEKITEISGLWITPSERGKHLGYEIMRQLIERSKQKRIYIDTVKSLESYFAVFGFTPLKITPEVFLEKIQKIREWLKKEKQPIPKAWRKGEIVYMVYNVMKYKLDPSFTTKPHLIVVDGGKPQLSAALQSLKQFNLNIPVCALAKRLEEIYFPDKQAPILLEEGEEALKLLQRLRDEAHRFAIEFQRDLKRKGLFS